MLIGRRVIMTDEGVYHPMALGARVGLYVVAMCAIAGLALAGRLTLASAAMYFALVGVPFAWALYTYLKFGRLGRPSVLLADGAFLMDRPQSTDGMIRFPLAELRDVLIYGMRGKRIYRFTRQDGKVDEISPLWGRKVEMAVIEFILDRLAPGVKVTVEEPQTLFGAFRRDKP